MLRRNHMIVTAALVAVCALPATAAAQQDLRMPDTRDAAAAAEEYQDLRSPDAVDAAAQRGIYAPDDGRYVLDRNYGSPDAVDAARDLPPVQLPTPVVEVRGTPSGGFDWDDAGIGAAGMLALFSISAGSALLLVGRKRRREVQVATH